MVMQKYMIGLGKYYMSVDIKNAKAPVQAD